MDDTLSAILFPPPPKEAQSHFVRDLSLSTCFHSEILFSSKFSSCKFLGMQSSLWGGNLVISVTASYTPSIPYELAHLMVSILFLQTCSSSKLGVILKMPLTYRDSV